MSTRITLRIGNTTPDDLEIQRFLQVLRRKNLSRQGWIKHAMILGFAQLEKDLESTEPTSGDASGVRKSKKQRPLAGSQPVPQKTDGPSVNPDIVPPASSATRDAFAVMPQPQPPQPQPQPVAQPVAQPQPQPVAQPQPMSPPQVMSQPFVDNGTARTAAPPSPEGTGGILSDEEMQFSPSTVQQARKLIGSFGKGYDG